MKLLEQLQDKVGKDVGDFGGWHGLKDYCLNMYGDDVEVLMMVAFVDAKLKAEVGDEKI